MTPVEQMTREELLAELSEYQNNCNEVLEADVLERIVRLNRDPEYRALTSELLTHGVKLGMQLSDEQVKQGLRVQILLAKTALNV